MGAIIRPRWYQEAACTAVVDYLSSELWRPRRFPLVVLPTGAGKTIVFSLLCKQFFSMGQPKMLILAHRKELILQAEAKLKSVWEGAPVGVYSAGAGRRELRDITVASRDTFVGVLKHTPRFDVVFVDEAHNISKREKTQYRKIIDALLSVNPRLVVIGLTATPYRLDSGLIYGKGEIFTHMVFEAPIKRLIYEGFLCPLKARQVDSHGVIDMRGVKKTGGDFNLKEMSERASNFSVVEAALDEWHRLAWQTGRKCTAIYCVTVEHAKLVSETLWNTYRIYFPVLTGETPADERDEIIADLDSGNCKGVANVGVLTEGWDCPRLDCIALLRSTMSLGLYMQMLGRGLRPFETKTDTLVLDYGGNIARFGPIDIAQPPAKQDRGEPRVKVCENCDTINKPFASFCIECNQPFLKDNQFKLCPECKEENAMKAVKCVACGEVLVNHEGMAAGGNIISEEDQEPEPKWYTVNNVSAQAMRSKNNNPYLKVVYQVGLSHAFFRNLMIGFKGRLGAEARHVWREITAPDTPLPYDASGAARLARQEGCLRKPHKILVDINSKYKDILRVTYREDESEEAA